MFVELWNFNWTRDIVYLASSNSHSSSQNVRILKHYKHSEITIQATLVLLLANRGVFNTAWSLGKLREYVGVFISFIALHPLHSLLGLEPFSGWPVDLTFLLQYKWHFYHSNGKQGVKIIYHFLWTIFWIQI